MAKGWVAQKTEKTPGIVFNDVLIVHRPQKRENARRRVRCYGKSAPVPRSEQTLGDGSKAGEGAPAPKCGETSGDGFKCDGRTGVEKRWLRHTMGPLILVESSHSVLACCLRDLDAYLPYSFMQPIRVCPITPSFHYTY